MEGKVELLYSNRRTNGHGIAGNLVTCAYADGVPFQRARRGEEKRLLRGRVVLCARRRDLKFIALDRL